MRSHLMINNFLIALAITSQTSIGAVSVSNTVSTGITETGLVQIPDHSSDVNVYLRTPIDSTISFRQENDPDSTTRKIPHLVLKRNGVLTPGFERTLLVSVNHLSIPKDGLFVDLTIETQHDDPDLSRGESNKIEIWHGIRFVPYTGDSVQSADFRITFNQKVRPERTTIQTPTDYYAYHLSLINAQGETLQESHEDYSFLLESQWTVPLPHVLEDSPEAAPHQLVLYYCDMFPFQRYKQDPRSQLERQEVERYIQTMLVPAMVHAFEIQTNVWELPWYREWTSSRADIDPKTLSVALGEYKTWYHGTSLFLGNAMISIRVDGAFGEYATLTDGILSVFHHELFHNQQRNISLHFRGSGNLSGKDDAWKMFSEGTAVLASAVGQPNVELEPMKWPRSYVQRVKAFLGEDGLIGGGLNESYTEIPYHTAIYWRFLYEHCGGLVNGSENPAAGMQVIRHVLEILYQGTVVDINSSPDAARALPEIMDLALQETPSCEFRTYDQSLLRFSEAVFLLRMQNGRCTATMEDRDCGFFDPHHLYATPNAEIYSITTNAETSIQGSIPSSYGIDLMEFNLDGGFNHKVHRILVETSSGMQDQFCMEVLQIESLKPSSESDRTSIPIEEPRSICTQNGYAALEIDPANMDNISGIGIILTRLDTHERLDSGEYSLQVRRK
jgi:hypothetical protein